MSIYVRAPSMADPRCIIIECVNMKGGGKRICDECSVAWLQWSHLGTSDVRSRNSLDNDWAPIRCAELRLMKHGLWPITPVKQRLEGGHNCECGAHKLGIKSKQAGHSSWCPDA